MTIERYSKVIPASGVIQIPPGNFFLLTTVSSGSVDVRVQGPGTSEGVNGAIGGVYITRVKTWQFIELFGSAGITVEYWTGAENVDRDITDIRLAVAAIAGSVSTTEVAATALANTAPVTLPTGASTLIIAANASRKRVRFTVQFDDPGPINLQMTAGAAGAGIAQLQGGQFMEFKNTVAFYGRNDSGADVVVFVAEES